MNRLNIMLYCLLVLSCGVRGRVFLVDTEGKDQTIQQELSVNGHDNIGQDYMGEDYKGEDFIREDYIGEDYLGSHSVQIIFKVQSIIACMCY